jgi:hypothetical protein
MVAHASRAKRARISSKNPKSAIEMGTHSADSEGVSEYHGGEFVTDEAAELRAQLLVHLRDPAHDLHSVNGINGHTTQVLLEQWRKDREARENLPKELLLIMLWLVVDRY